MPLFSKRQINKRLELDDGYDVNVEIVPEDLLPSSKIGILRLREKETEPPEKKEPKLLPGSKSFLMFPEEPEPEKSE